MAETAEPIEEIFAEDDMYNKYNAKSSELSYIDNIGLFYQSGIDVLTGYGWYIAALLAISFYLYQKYRLHLERFNVFNRSSNQSEIVENPDEILARQEAMEMARRKMQERLDKLVEEERIKMKEKEEQKRKEKIEEWEKFQSGGTFRSRNRLGTGSSMDEPSSSASGSSKKPPKDKKKDKSLRGEFNPLTGSGFGSSYRPSRRGMSGGG